MSTQVVYSTEARRIVPGDIVGIWNPMMVTKVEHDRSGRHGGTMMWFEDGSRDYFPSNYKVDRIEAQ